MPYKTFLGEFLDGFFIGGAVSGFMVAAFWLTDKICDQDEQIEELVSRCEEKDEQIEELVSRCDEKDKLKKRCEEKNKLKKLCEEMVSLLEACEKRSEKKKIKKAL